MIMDDGQPGAREEEHIIRLERMGREQKLDVEARTAKPGARYREVSWRKTAPETLRQIQREVDRMRGSATTFAAPAPPRPAALSGLGTVPPGAHDRVTALLGPIADLQFVYSTSTGVVLRALHGEGRARTRTLVLVSADAVRTIGDLHDAVDHIREPRERKGQPVVDIEGIGETYNEKLEAADILTTEDLREADPEHVAEITGAPRATVDKWVAMADLLRVNGIGKQFAELLVRAGVASVEDLARQRAAALYKRIIDYQDSVDVTIQKAPISEGLVERWIKAAQGPLQW